MAHSIGKTIATLRKARGWTQLELAEKLQVSDKTISKWEKDGGSPSIEFFPILAKIFDVSIDYLMTGTTPTNAQLDNSEIVNKSKGEDMMLTEQYFFNGILDIEKVVAENNYEFAQKAINENPIHIVELIYSYIRENNWRKIFEFAIDNDVNSVAKAILKQRFDIAETKLLEALWCVDVNKPEWQGVVSRQVKAYRKVNQELLGLTSLGKKSYIGGAVKYSGIMYDKDFATFDYAINYLRNKRVEILSDIKIKLAYQNIQNELNAEYFEKQLKNENFEIVIIKLCVLLETVLRSKYNCTGEIEFSEILEKYCIDYLQDNEKTASLLHKLRKSRNSLVHPDQNETILGLDELKACIDYILNLA